MYLKRLVVVLAVALWGCLAAHAQTNSKWDYFSVPGPIHIADTDFDLVWTANPNAFYFKHEYLPSDQKFKNYNRLFLMEVMIADMDANDALAMKVNELEQRKATDPVVKFQTYQKDNETVIDFIISQINSDQTQFEFIERNLYRYIPIEVEGKSAILLLGISERGYPHNMEQFIGYLKTNMEYLLHQMLDMPVPTIKLNRQAHE